MSFEWQTQEESWEDDPPAAEAEEATPERRSRPLLWLLLMVVLLGSVGLVLYGQLQEQVGEVAEQVEEDVRTSNRLVRLAANERDFELLAGVLSGRDPDWVDLHEMLVEQGMLLDRPALGLRLSREVEEPVATEVVLSPDLTSATVTITETYQTAVGNGISETVLLVQEQIYRLGPEQWVLAPPLEEVATLWEAHEGRYLTLIAPSTDVDLHARLARDIENKLAEMCVQVEGVDCPADYHRAVRLNVDPDGLLVDGSLAELAEQGVEIQLPAPAVVGRPVDEAGYRALLRGYAGYVVGVALLDVWGWECCEQEEQVAAQLQRALAGLGLRPAPGPADDSAAGLTFLRKRERFKKSFY